jgi:hypothetical protein
MSILESLAIESIALMSLCVPKSVLSEGVVIGALETGVPVGDTDVSAGVPVVDTPDGLLPTQPNADAAIISTSMIYTLFIFNQPSSTRLSH